MAETAILDAPKGEPPRRGRRLGVTAVLVAVVVVAVALFVVVLRATETTDVPPGTIPPTSPPTSLDPLSREIEQLVPGHLAFELPTQMRVGDDATVFVRISKGLDTDLSLGLVGKGTVVEETLPHVSSAMVVELSGDTFDTSPLTSTRQAVVDDDVTQWEWQVTPQVPGVHTLHLKVSLELSVEADRTSKDVPVADKDVDVSVNLPYQTRTWLSDNWDKLLGLSVVSGLIVAVVRRLQKTMQRRRDARRPTDVRGYL
jgi:hypothetical protein